MVWQVFIEVGDEAAGFVLKVLGLSEEVDSVTKLSSALDPLARQ
jgi:hypothetical protein